MTHTHTHSRYLAPIVGLACRQSLRACKAWELWNLGKFLAHGEAHGATPWKRGRQAPEQANARLWLALQGHGHAGLLVDMGPYEVLSTGNGPDYKGLVSLAELWKGLLRVEPSGEIHSQPLKIALLSIMADNEHINKTSFTALERVSCLLAHLRKIKRDGSLQVAAARLTIWAEALKAERRVFGRGSLGKGKARTAGNLLGKGASSEETEEGRQ